MDQPQILLNSDNIVVIKELFTNLKDLITWSREHKDSKVVVLVSTSRYLKILSDYWAMYAINIDGGIERYLQYKYYYLKGIDKNNNIFKIVRIKSEEYKGKCESCTCNKKKWMNPNTKECYYKEMITNDYYTPKIKINESNRQK